MTDQERDILNEQIAGWEAMATSERADDRWSSGETFAECAETLRDLVAMFGDGWISVSERLPEERADVLATLPDGEQAILYYGRHWSHGGSVELKFYGNYEFDNWYVAHPTHWQPLPKGPKR